MEQIRRSARRAGLWYALACAPAPFALVYVPGALVAAGDATATAQRLRASGVLLRMAIAGELFNAIVIIFAVLAFYRLFRRVSETLALALAGLYLVSVPISLLNVLNEIAALLLARGGGFVSLFDRSQSDALAYLFMHLHGQGLVLAGLFWGLWLFPFGLVVIRSGFIPRALGVFQIVAGAGYTANSLTSLLLPDYAPLVGRIAMVLAFGELPILVWLLIWGARTPRSEPALSSPARG